MLTKQERAIVKAEILRWHRRAWTVHVASVMPDHVHILATPLQGAPGRWYSLSTILGRVKGRSSWEINRRCGREGPRWLSESYDHVVRDAREFSEIWDYILSNAGVAGLPEYGYDYDGFWCEGMEAIAEDEKATPERRIVPRQEPPQLPCDLPLVDAVEADETRRTRRNLPHLQVAGATYFIIFRLQWGEGGCSSAPGGAETG